MPLPQIMHVLHDFDLIARVGDDLSVVVGVSARRDDQLGARVLVVQFTYLRVYYGLLLSPARERE